MRRRADFPCKESARLSSFLSKDVAALLESTADAHLAQFLARFQHQSALPEIVDFLRMESARSRIFRGHQLPQRYVKFIQRGVNRRYLRFQFRDGFRQ